MAQRGVTTRVLASGILVAGAVLAVGLAGCGAPATKPAPPAPTSPPPPPPPPPPKPLTETAPAPPKDACGADALQYLVGKPRSEIPIPVEPNRRRVVCSSCMVTQDYVPYRQTITWDSNTGLVMSVKCG